eukprot:TRINITY_DN206_c2_g1_i2.p1 TRINITY_DN206_c2_g1~~TRINITY_DN206_c2_g1_i2.p1  ORF type:complete len:336 (-),score=67.82 TRINITY_DN206_c2_g1_i2:306-1313(-)
METRSLKGEKRRENLEAIVTPNSCYHVQSWYPLVQKDTFDTKFFALSFEQAQAIVAYAGGSLAVGPDQPDYANYRFGRRFVKKNPEEESRLVKVLDGISELIDAKIKEFSNCSGVFVRLSSRSPKDVCDYALYETYLKDLAALNKEEGATVDSNPVYQKIAFTRASCNVLKATCGLDAMKLFLNSQRVFEDLSMAISVYNSNSEVETFQMQVVVRRWEDIRQEWEFRAFVFDGVLTACTQYYAGVYVPKLVANIDYYKQRIVSFWHNSVKSVMEHGSLYLCRRLRVGPHHHQQQLLEQQQRLDSGDQQSTADRWHRALRLGCRCRQGVDRTREVV